MASFRLKKHIIILTALLVVTCMLKAQEKFTEGNMQINGQVFQVGFSKMFPIIIAWNVTKNTDPLPFAKREPGVAPLPINNGDMEVDTLMVW